ncbi:molybdenum cofactor biosynthesis F family protein [Agrococcus versicolor]|uniref:Molybdenum cofactor biosynthesis F family protein n=1 Tax=Agrococcus versicolor TaxID=501482 RepID=A0ABN3AM46_9MICO
MTSTFIPVGALGDGFAHASRSLDVVDHLEGRAFALDLDGADTLSIGRGVASWGDAVDVPVRVTSIRPGIFLVGGIAGSVSTAFVLDLDAGLVTLVEGTLPDEATRAESAFTRVQRGDEATGVAATLRHGRIDGSVAEPHAATDDLVGLRNRYDYSTTEVYEHIYLTPTLYAWHCIEGVERGLADVDACHHVRIRDGLTLFVWREKIVPTLGLILIDLDAMRTDGSIFGNAGFDASTLVTFPVGATAEILTVTAHAR